MITSKNSYWNNQGKYQADHDRLCKKLIPSYGQSNYTHGELLRITERIYYDHYNNSRCNMTDDSMYSKHFVPFINWSMEYLFPIAVELGYETFERDMELYLTCIPDHQMYIRDGVVPDEVMDRVMDIVVVYVSRRDALVTAAQERAVSKS